MAEEERGNVPVTHGQLEMVIRRAAELQFLAQGRESGPELDESELVRIGEEVGLDGRYVRQALAEMRADSLLPALPKDASLPARLWGVGVLRFTRVVPGEPAEVRRKVEAHFRERESLRQLRDQPGRSLWEPASGILSQMQRTLDVRGHGYELAKARRVELSVEGLESGRSLVTIVVDARNLRTGAAAAWFGGIVPFGALATVGLVLGLDAHVAISVLAATGSGGVTLAAASYVTARGFRRRKERLELAAQGLLDRLEQGRPLQHRAG